MTGAGEALLAVSRRRFHAALLESGVLCIATRKNSKKNPDARLPSNADGDSTTSIAIAQAIYDQIHSQVADVVGDRMAGQASGSKFEHLVRAFVSETFPMFEVLRPGRWSFPESKRAISRFEQYRHLSELEAIAATNPEIAVLLGSEYVIGPDILVVREPETDAAINANAHVVDGTAGLRSGIRQRNSGVPILHASVSCKWTLRSDRAQNARSEALNLLRNRKGRAPHIVVVTGEPLPSRLASIALGTGDVDCVYHFALPELIHAVHAAGVEDAANMVNIMVEGRRLKDIADLPLDLTV